MAARIGRFPSRTPNGSPRTFPPPKHASCLARVITHLSLRTTERCWTISSSLRQPRDEGIQWEHLFVCVESAAVAASDRIVISGAREHNLKDIDVELPRDALIVITGLSGSGKSSLAFDTIYAEGQRRYVESLSSYARQFLGLMEKPDVDSIEGLSPAISIDQKT